MDKLLQPFLNHLIQIGFATSNTLRLFIESYTLNSIQNNQLISQITQKNSSTEIYFRERITKSLIAYLNAMDTNQKQELALNIYTQFISKNHSNKRNCIQRLVLIYKQFQHKKAAGNKIKKFKQWKKLLNGSSYSIFLNLSCHSEKSQRCNRNSSSLLETSRFLREQEELMHCTFHPSLNQTRHYRSKTQSSSNKDHNLSLSVHDRLYTDHKKICAKKEVMRLENDNKIGKIASFRPCIVSMSPKAVGSNFKERLKSFVQKKIDNKNRLIETIENNFLATYSFSPNISVSQKTIPLARSPSCILVPAYKRLYMQSDINKQNNAKKIEEASKKSDLKSSSSVNNVLNKEGPVDYKKIEELYNDYKRLKKKAELRQCELDKERGITFRPKISVNEKYNGKLNDNFFEREKKFVEEKKKFVNIFNEIIDEHTRGNRWGNGKYSDKEKEAIAKGVVDRLYFKGRDIARIKRGIYVEDKNNNCKVQFNNDNNNDNEFEEDLLNERSQSTISN